MVPRHEDREERWVADIELQAGAQDDEFQDHSESHNLLSTIAEPSGITKPPERTTTFLDGLRGVACFLVYMSHQHPWWYRTDDNLHQGFGYHGQHAIGTFPFIRILFNGGNAAVSIFFVLSGYVLSVGPLRTLRDGDARRTHRRLLSAFIRRPFRLFVPALAVALAFALIMHLPFGLAPALDWPEPKETLWLELRTWVYETGLMVNPFVKHGTFTRWYPYNPPSWTMPVEWAGSMLVFSSLGAAALVSRNFRGLFFAAVGLLLFLVKQWAMTCFLGGVILALNDVEDKDRPLLKRFSKRTVNITFTVLFIAAWWLLCQPANKREDPELSYATPGWYYLTMMTPAMYFYDEYWRFWNTPGAILLVYAILRLPFLQAFFSTRALKYLGRVSFSLYLLHIPFLWTVGDRVERMFGNARGSYETVFDNLLVIPDVGPTGFSTGFLVSQAIILPLNMLLAEVCTRLLDEPSIRIGKAVVARVAPWLEAGGSNPRR